MSTSLQHLPPRSRFIISRWAYSVGKSLIPDAEYNLLLEYMQQNYPDDPYTTRSWSSDPCPTDLLVSCGLESLIAPVVLADKTESIPSLNSSVEYMSELSNVNEPATLSMKHDGWNIQVNYYNGSLVTIHTRGRYTDSVDVSALRPYVPKTIPFTGKCKVVCELTVSKANFEYCRTQFDSKLPRSAVPTILARKELYHLLDIHAFAIHGYQHNIQDKFDILREWGFQTPEFIKVQTFEDVNNALAVLSSHKDAYASPTDGAVYAGSKVRAIRLQAWEEPVYKSYVTGYHEQFSAYRISPSVLIKPIVREGVTQTRISLTNWARIIQYNLQPGAPIAFRCASDAIADFDEDATRVLHETWEGAWDAYKQKIDLEASCYSKLLSSPSLEVL